jgi:hypothetical protein
VIFVQDDSFMPVTHGGVVMDPMTVLQHPRREGATRDLASRHLQGVSTLLSHREDLRGVHAFADVVEEAVRWCA